MEKQLVSMQIIYYSQYWNPARTQYEWIITKYNRERTQVMSKQQMNELLTPNKRNGVNKTDTKSLCAY